MSLCNDITNYLYAEVVAKGKARDWEFVWQGIANGLNDRFIMEITNPINAQIAEDFVLKSTSNVKLKRV